MDFAIKCPWCGNEHDGLKYIEPNDIEGEFVTDCEECEKQFAVKFKTTILFETERSE